MLKLLNSKRYLKSVSTIEDLTDTPVKKTFDPDDEEDEETFNDNDTFFDEHDEDIESSDEKMIDDFD